MYTRDLHLKKPRRAHRRLCNGAGHDIRRGEYFDQKSTHCQRKWERERSMEESCWANGGTNARQGEVCRPPYARYDVVSNANAEYGAILAAKRY